MILPKLVIAMTTISIIGTTPLPPPAPEVEIGHSYYKEQQVTEESTDTEKEYLHIEGGVVKAEDMYASLEDINFSFDQPVNEKSRLSKNDFVKLLEKLPYDYEGFYERNAEFIWEMEQKYSINALVYCGIAAQESGWGQYGGYAHNYTGMMQSSGELITYQTDEEGIEATFKNLSENFVAYGADTLSSISPKYAGNSEWASAVYSAIQMIIE